MNPGTQRLLRSLPSVTSLLEDDEVREWLAGLSRPVVVEALQQAVEEARSTILSGRNSGAVDPREIIGRAETLLLKRSVPSLRRVVNATGVILHTGLGRAPLCGAAIEAIAETASGYCNLEFDLERGARGARVAHVAEHLTALTGAQAATVVNNNAAATLMILRTFAAGREVIVSRGQLVEIGGSFRLPEIMAESGAILREVGTTNRTRIGDYQRAINDRTAILMRVHTSNYRIIGFTESAPLAELVQLARRFNLLCVDDLGSGALMDLSAQGLPEEPCAADSVRAGADLVCFSGDKLLGGPQAGLIAGRGYLIERIEATPLMRTYRVDKLVLAALEATLREYRDNPSTWPDVPCLRMLCTTAEELSPRAARLAEQLREAAPDEQFFIASDVSFAGGGSLPEKALETVVIHWRPSFAPVEIVSQLLRDADIPVMARIRDDALCFDLRTVTDEDFEPLTAAVSGALWACQDEPEEPEGSGEES